MGENKNIPTLRRQRQAGVCEFQANLVYNEFQPSQSYILSVRMEKKEGGGDLLRKTTKALPWQSPCIDRSDRFLAHSGVCLILREKRQAHTHGAEENVNYWIIRPRHLKSSV